MKHVNVVEDDADGQSLEQLGENEVEMRQDEDPVQEVQTSSRTRSSGGRLTHSFYPVSRSRATMELSPHPNDICLRSLHMNVS
jgi:hypothetical protein